MYRCPQLVHGQIHAYTETMTPNQRFQSYSICHAPSSVPHHNAGRPLVGAQPRSQDLEVARQRTQSFGERQTDSWARQGSQLPRCQRIILVT